METNSILCIADLNKSEHQEFVNGTFIEAQIICGTRKVTAVPTESLVKSGKNQFVFILVKKDPEYYYLRKLKVNVGDVLGSYTEIKDPDSLSNILIKGVYNLIAE